MCGFHTETAVRAGGRFAESLEALCSTHTHTHTQDRYPAVREIKKPSNKCKLRFTHSRSAVGMGPIPGRAKKRTVGPGPRAQNPYFVVFGPPAAPPGPVRGAVGILRGVAFTSQSLGPNGGFPTPFVPEIVFFGGCT